MMVTAKTLIESQYAGSSNTVEYTVPANSRAIIDKFTATNVDTSARTVSVHIIPSGASVDDQYLIIDAKSIPDSTTTSGAVVDLTELKGHVLEAGGKISVVASVASKIVIRASGREVKA
jgi:hypothetical protein